MLFYWETYMDTVYTQNMHKKEVRDGKRETHGQQFHKNTKIGELRSENHSSKPKTCT